MTMRRYYRKRAHTRTAECWRTAARLTQRGWKRIGACEYRQLRRLRDLRRIAELRQDAPAAYSMCWRTQHTARMQAMIDAARGGAPALERSVGGGTRHRIVGALPGVVYPEFETGL